MIDDIHLVEIQSKKTNAILSKTIDVSINTVNGVSDVHMRWTAEDSESGIDYYLWSVGKISTVQQYQDLDDNWFSFLRLPSKWHSIGSI